MPPKPPRLVEPAAEGDAVFEPDDDPEEPESEKKCHERPDPEPPREDD
jgi:hypothetical protein